MSALGAWVLSGVLCPAAGHTPVLDGSVDDWCLGAPANGFEAGGRVEDSAATLACGRCSGGNRACLGDSDCWGVQTCVDPGSKLETVWWDRRTDAAVNDLATLATTQDNSNLYFALQQWGGADPVQLPLMEIAIDFQAGGLGAWRDPLARLTTAGTCSNDSTRACTGPLDCHFCALSNEPYPSTRRRTCGSDDPSPLVGGSGSCSDLPGDACRVTPDIRCDGIGTASVAAVGLHSTPAIAPDYLLVIDLGRTLVGAPGPIQLLQAVQGEWSPAASVDLSSNAGAGTGWLFAQLEFAIPWSAFGCAGCPLDCACPGFGPGQAFRYTGLTARDAFSLDHAPDGPIEDVFSEPVAGSTTASSNSCPGIGPASTACELADGSHDAFVQVGAAEAGGRVSGLAIDKADAELRLSWTRSCSWSDVDYQVYSGRLGDFSSHEPLAGGCSTAGATESTIEIPQDDVYFLVVPTDAAIEGSYGVAGDGSQRPASATACRPQSLAGCPARCLLCGDRQE